MILCFLFRADTVSREPFALVETTITLIALLVVLCSFCQWLAWRVKLPAILLLLATSRTMKLKRILSKVKVNSEDSRPFDCFLGYFLESFHAKKGALLRRERQRAKRWRFGPFSLTR
jgi:hypothetical protein